MFIHAGIITRLVISKRQTSAFIELRWFQCSHCVIAIASASGLQLSTSSELSPRHLTVYPESNQSNGKLDYREEHCPSLYHQATLL